MDNEKERLIKKDHKRNVEQEELQLSTTKKSTDGEDSLESSFLSTPYEPVTPQRSWTTFVILILTPVILCPLPITLKSQESKAGYGILIMIVYWVTEVTPMAVTATLPLFIFPILGVLTSGEVAAAYMQDSNVLFLGGLLVFVAFEQCDLHKRIAMKSLLLLGTKKPNLIFGFMLTTALISMLLSNTATAAMMVQIVKVILSELEKTNLQRNTQPLPSTEVETPFQDDSIQNNPLDIVPHVSDGSEKRRYPEKEKKKKSDNFGKVLMLAVAFSANIGGIATLTGTGTNMIFSGQARKIFPKSGGVSFSSWFGFAFPLMIVLLVISWMFLVFLFLGWRSFLSCFSKEKGEDSKTIQEIIQIEYASLGEISFAEVAVLLHLIVLVILWLTKEPQFMPGWNSIFKEGYVSDGTVALLVAFLLFQFPSQRPNVLCWKKRKSSSSSVRPLLDLQTVSEKLCWNVLVLLGGGFAIAAACQKSGLSTVISRRLSALSSIPDYAVVAVACITVTAMTEILSNTGTATIFLPVLASIATSAHIHPWYLMIPATISCSFAFMFPISTPANAIVYSTGKLKMWDMVKAGICMDIICLIVLLVFVNTYGGYYYKWLSYPDWAVGVIGPTISPLNATRAAPTI